MPLEKTEKLCLIISTVFGLLALLLVCVGIGTPNWEATYTITGNGTYSLAYTANFFYTCRFTNGSFVNCTRRTTNLTDYPRYSSAVPWMVDYNSRMQNAAGLCVVAILFLIFGIVTTLIRIFISLSDWFHLLSPALFFLACLFMLAGVAEGARYLLYNDYSANLYQAGHLFTILALVFNTFAVGSIHIRLREELKKPAAK